MFTAGETVLKNRKSWQIYMEGLRTERNGRLHPGNKLVRKALNFKHKLSSTALSCSLTAPFATSIEA
jgi:hypothetical protein